MYGVIYYIVKCPSLYTVFFLLLNFCYIQYVSFTLIYQKYFIIESVVAKVVRRRWALDHRVAGWNHGQVAVFEFLGKMLNLNASLHPGV